MNTLVSFGSSNPNKNPIAFKNSKCPIYDAEIVLPPVVIALHIRLPIRVVAERRRERACKALTYSGATHYHAAPRGS